MSYQIETDGRTVWVNAPLCIGRFCKLGGEVVKNKRCCMSSLTKQTEPNWQQWTKAMREVHGIDVPDKYRPEWCKS